jgi:hypothetical protein
MGNWRNAMKKVTKKIAVKDEVALLKLYMTQ